MPLPYDSHFAHSKGQRIFYPIFQELKMPPRKSSGRSARSAKASQTSPGISEAALQSLMGHNVLAIATDRKDPQSLRAAIAAAIQAETDFSADRARILEDAPSGNWILFKSGLFPISSPGYAVSKRLKTRVLDFCSDDNSMFIEYNLFDKGRLVERLEICESFPGCTYELVHGQSPGQMSPQPGLFHLHLDQGHSYVTFESTLIKATKKQVNQWHSLLDQRFKALGICILATH